MAEYKEEGKKTNWVEWRNKRIGRSGEAPQRANLKFGRIAWCQAFDRGDQYKKLDEVTGEVKDVFITRETRCIYNVCRTFNDAYAAKMWKGNPVPTTSPFSTNTEDYDEDVSVATNAAVEYWWKTVVNGPIKGNGTTRTAAVGGIGWAKILYNKNQKSGLYDGEVIWDRVNPLHAYPNADATCDEEIREFDHHFPKEKSVAEEEFAEQMKKLGITELQSQSKNDAHPDIAETSKKISSLQSDEVKETVIIDDIWITACKKYPKHWVAETDEFGMPAVDDQGNPKGEWRGGRHVIMVGDDVLVDEECSEPECDSVPFFSFAVNKSDDDLIGIGVTYPIIPIQRDMNKLNSIVAENADTMGHLKWVIKEGSVTNPSAFDNMSGEVISYSGDTAPKQSTASPLPVHITGRFWELMEMAKFITKIQALDLGTIPKGGSQMSTGTTNRMTESEEVMFSPEINRLKDFVGRIVRRYLFLAKKYYKEERIVTITGENKRPEAVAFKAEALQDNYNVDIKVGEGFSRSDDAQVMAITNLMQTPAFDQSGIDPRVVMEEMMKKMGLTKLKEDTFKDERQAKRYLKLILSGENAPYSEFVNPNAHIKVFTDFIKQPQYDGLDVKIRVGIDRYLKQMVNMTMGQNAPPPAAVPPGNTAPIQSQPQDMGGRPPMPNNELAASPPAPQGDLNG